MTTDDIQDEIERTRGEMASTLSAIERKLSPRQIMDQAVDTMREIASDQSRVGNMVRENPIPLALIGLGIGWLAIAGTMSRKRDSEMGSYESMEGVGSEWSGSAGIGGSSSYGYASGSEGVGYGSPGGTGYGAGSTEYSTGGGNGQGVREKAGQIASEAGERVRSATSGARARVGEWTRSARSTANQAAWRTRETYQEHPLTMGLVAALAGAALGALLPTSRREQEMMRGTADELMARARETGSEVMDKAARVADRAVQAAKDETRQAIREEKDTSSLSGSSMTH